MPNECPELSEEERAICDGAITIDECKLALDGMMNNKSPSVSGFSKEFYKLFWNELGGLVVGYINDAKTNNFFVTQRRDVLVLIPRKGDPKLIRNKRPICLLDIVYKIAAKALTNRLSKVINKLISRDQTGSIKGRYIGENLRIIADTIEYCDIDNLEGMLLALDFKNAYNTVEHRYLHAVLRRFKFGEDFIDWIKLFHRDTEIAVSNNGFISPWFKPTRGLQQGCPISGCCSFW